MGGSVWQRLWQENKLPVGIFGINRNENQLFKSPGLKIIFTMQIGGISRKLEELLEMSPPDWNWWIRCHPMRNNKMNEYENDLKRFKVRTNVIEPTNAYLPELLKNADAHITGWSAVTYDALYYGLKSIFVHPSAKRFFNHLLKSQMGYYIENNEDIIDKIKFAKTELKFTQKTKLYESIEGILAN